MVDHFLRPEPTAIILQRDHQDVHPLVASSPPQPTIRTLRYLVQAGNMCPVLGQVTSVLLLHASFLPGHGVLHGGRRLMITMFLSAFVLDIKRWSPRL